MLPTGTDCLDDDLKQRGSLRQRRLSSQSSSPLRSLTSPTDSQAPSTAPNKPNIVDLGLHIVGAGFKQQITDVYQEPTMTSSGTQTKRQRRKSIDVDQFQFLTFDKAQPPSNEIVEDLFDQLLHQRSFSNDIKVNLKSVSIARKWALICQEQNGNNMTQGSLIRSPKWFTSKIKYLDSMELHKLERCLRGREFTDEFLALEGHIGLMDLKLNSHDRKIEFLLVSCYKSLVNSPKGTDIISQDVKVLTFLIKTMLGTEELKNKKLVTDILVLICYWLPPLGRNNILKAFNNLSTLNMFKEWIESLTRIMEGELSVFSKVQVKELMLSSMFLIVAISEGSESVNDQKIIHFKFKEVGIYSLFYMMQQINDQNINEQIDKFKAGEVTTFAHEISDELHLRDSQIDAAFKSIKSKIINNDTLTDVTTSLLKMLLEILVKNSKSQSLNIFKFIESIISSISTSNKELTENSGSVINASIQRLMDRLTTDDIAQRAIIEAKELEEVNQGLTTEIVSLKESLKISRGDILERNRILQTELDVKDKEIEMLKNRVVSLEKLTAADRIKQSKETAKISFTNLPIQPSRMQTYSSHAAKLVQSLNQRSPRLSDSTNTKKPSLVRSKSAVRLPFLRGLDNLDGSVGTLGEVNEEHHGRTSVTSSWESMCSSGTTELAGPRISDAACSNTNSISLYGSSGKAEGAQHIVPGGFTILQSNCKLGENFSTDGTKSSHSSTPGSSDQQSALSLLSLVPKGHKLHTGATVQSDMQSTIEQPSIPKLLGSDSNSHSTSSESSSIPTPPPLPEMFSTTGSSSSAQSVNFSIITSTQVPSPPPPPPPLPEMLVNLTNMAKGVTVGPPSLSLSDLLKTDNSSAPNLNTTVQISAPLPPPPPGMPGMPDFQKDITETGSQAKHPIIPPPPPALPDFLKLSANSDNDPPKESAPLPPPPPPAPQLPAFLKDSLQSDPGLASGPPLPPPPPPLPNLLKSETDSNSSPPPPPPMPDLLNKDSPPKLKINTKSAQDKLTQNKIDEISKALHKPTKKLKQLHWDKVEQVENTLWNDINYLSRMNELQALGILREVEDLFDVKVTAKKQSPITPVKKIELITFLPRDLSQQFGINLHMFANVPEEELVEKVLKCDYDILNNISVLEFFNRDELCEISPSLLKNFKPYITDYQKGKVPERDVSLLERADRLYLDLCINLRHYWRSRSRALVVIKTYERDYYDLLSKLQRIEDSVKAIKNSKSLKNLFILIREIGNFMNRKQVEGFKLASLQKLSFIKDHNQNTFLHYVEKVIRKAYPEYLAFLQELAVLQDSAKISIEQLSQDIQAFLSSVRNIDKSMEIGNLSDPKKLHPLDMVLNKLTPKLPEAKKKCMLLENQHKYVLEDFEKAMKYFGEDSKDTVARSTFLSNFEEFKADFERVQKDNMEAEMKKKIYERRKQEILQNQSKTKYLRTKSADNVNEAEGEDVVENLLKRLKGVSTDRRRVSTSGASLQRRESANDNELFTRAQTMLEGTKKINI